MIATETLRNLFLDGSHSDCPISYLEFKAAGLSDEEYLVYCNLCEAVRGTCILFWNRFPSHSSQCESMVDDALLDLKRWLEKALDTAFTLDIPVRILTMPKMLHYHWEPEAPETSDDVRILSRIFLGSEDFRHLLEGFIRQVWILGKEIQFTSYEQKANPSKKEKRESCEFYANSKKCLLSGGRCDQDECAEYEKFSGLPIRRIPTGEDTVGFLDTVWVSSTNGPDISVVMPAHHEQSNMQPIQKALIHRKIGETITAGATTYNIHAIKKAPQPPRRKHKPTCLLSEWQKAENKLWELELESMRLSKPVRPKNLGNSAALLKWAKEAGYCIEREEELDDEIEEYRILLDKDV